MEFLLGVGFVFGLIFLIRGAYGLTVYSSEKGKAMNDVHQALEEMGQSGSIEDAMRLYADEVRFQREQLLIHLGMCIVGLLITGSILWVGLS